MSAAEQDFALGEPVLIAGYIVGRSEFQDGPRSYLVEFNRRGKPARERFLAVDLQADGEEEGAGI